ncbi:hypothetical protein V5O48_017669 [Marasmius crinis-equi]|uniref:Retrotransposon gag domain-containing protein n=1 Tax=Marasmius crinis-equi TaxID=585013 RepID=A0ABR3ENC0_9AGAR
MSGEATTSQGKKPALSKDFASRLPRSTEFTRQAPPHLEGQRQEDPQGNATEVEAPEEQFGLEPLQPLPSTIPLYRINIDSTTPGLELNPSLQGSYKFGKNSSLWQQPKRSIARETFPGITNILNKLMIKVTRGSVPASEANAKGDKPHILMLNAALQSFEFSGQQLPSTPIWPREGGSLGADFLLENDFEVLAITYRAMVEDYLVRLADIHDFRTNQPKLLPVMEQEVTIMDRLPLIFKTLHNNHLARETLLALRFEATVQDTILTHQQLRTRRVREMWQDSDDKGSEGYHSMGENPAGGPPSDSSGSDSSDDDDHRGGGNGGRRRRQRSRSASRGSNRRSSVTSNVQATSINTKPRFIFDLKLKFDTVPKWDGDTDTIMQWINEVNDLAKYGKEVRLQLGSIVPRRLEGTAKSWYYSLLREHRSMLEKDWKSLREEIGGFYMNRKWSENLRKKANRAHYRESEYSRETPSEYYIRKLNLIATAYDLDDSEIISEVMEGAPDNWNTILTTQNYSTVMDFQAAIRYHEETLQNLDWTDKFKQHTY